jgi:putative hydrolase of the HAD superfamily
MPYEELIKRYSKPLDTIPTSLSMEGAPRESVKAVLFDVYGTLFISKAGDIGFAKKEAEKNVGEINDLLLRYGVEESPDILLAGFFDEIEGEKEELRRGGVDYPEVVIEEIWKRVLKTDDTERARRFSIEYELIVNPVYPMPNLRELLFTCRDRHIPMGIVSNAQFYTPYLFSALLDGKPETLGFEKTLLFFSYKFGYGKPSLDFFGMAARELEKIGVSRENVLYIGNDILKDIYPAGTTGFQTALFAGDGRSLNLRSDDDRCGGIVPDIVITDLLQILDYI